MANKKTKDEAPKLPYLKIRNWAKFQTMTDKNGRSLEGRPRPYIRDFTDKENDALYVSLSLMGRYLIDACRRLRGQLGCNLPNDHLWILRRLDVHHSERGRGVVVLQSLVTRGFLIPTNERFSVPQPAEASLSIGLSVEGINTGKATATVQPTDSASQTGQKEQNQPPSGNVSGDWLSSLSPDETDKAAAVLQWAAKTSDFWQGKTLKSLKAYRTAERSYDKFYASAKKKPHQLPAKAKAKATAAPNGILGPQTDEEWKNQPVEMCSCSDPIPDTNGDSAYNYGVDCRRCHKFVYAPGDAKFADEDTEMPKSAFEIED